MAENIDEYIDQLQKLQKKYEAMGQDLGSYLDGLLYANYLTYWDYIHLDTLLSLQTPKTDFPDEKVFIVYHQITELYFNLIIHEMEQLAEISENDYDSFLKHIKRINRYFFHLVDSFKIMVDGMDKDQFLKFRMSLLPASGFQSAQYRMIEVMATDFINLVHHEKRQAHNNQNSSIEEMFEDIYWKKGASELATGKKTLTLKKFENKYRKELVDLGAAYKSKNILSKYKGMNSLDEEKKEVLNSELRMLDALANINWPLAHFKSAAKYLHKEPESISATGGTNWQKYLPPKYQLQMFYPELWSDEEKKNWGRKAAVL